MLKSPTTVGSKTRLLTLRINQANILMAKSEFCVHFNIYILQMLLSDSSKNTLVYKISHICCLKTYIYINTFFHKFNFSKNVLLHIQELMKLTKQAINISLSNLISGHDLHRSLIYTDIHYHVFSCSLLFSFVHRNSVSCCLQQGGSENPDPHLPNQQL